jgi:hypothetical protein
MDVYETQVKLSFVVPTGEVDRIKGLIGSALSPSLGGKVGGMGKLMGGAIGKAGLALGAAGAIVMSSPSLQKTLEHIMKSVMLLIRPIGDIISIGLRPIIDILRPVGMFFRILIKPYLTKAMEAMRLGRGFMAAGEPLLAASAYALGAEFLLKPFFDMMVTVATISVQGVLWGIKMLGEGLLAVLDPLDVVRTSFGDTMDKAIQYVGEGGARIITETSLTMERWLVNLKVAYSEMETTSKTSMQLTSGFVGEGFIRIIQAATNFFAPNLEFATNTMFDNIVNYGIRKVNELNDILGDARATVAEARSAQEAWESLTPSWARGAVYGGGGGGGSSGAGGTEINIDLRGKGFFTDVDEFARYLRQEIGISTRGKV